MVDPPPAPRRLALDTGGSRPALAWLIAQVAVAAAIVAGAAADSVSTAVFAILLGLPVLATSLLVGLALLGRRSLRAIEVADGGLVLTWRRFGLVPGRLHLRLRPELRASVVGRQLVLRAGVGTRRFQLPPRTDPDVVRRFLRESAPEVVAAPRPDAPLEQSVVREELDRVELDLRSVYDPVPTWALLAGAAPCLLGVVGVASLGGAYAAVAFATLVALAAGLYWALRFSPVGLSVEVRAQRLSVVHRYRIGERREVLPLSELRWVEHQPDRVVLHGSEHSTDLPLAGRSEATRRALREFLSTHVDRATATGGRRQDVPGELRRLAAVEDRGRT